MAASIIPTAATVLHTVLFKFPDIEGEVPQELQSVLEKFNDLPGISAQFYPYGVGADGCASKSEFLERVSWPDKSEGYTHCLIVLATGVPALKGYLHSEEHLKAWMPAVKPYIKGILVFDSVLSLSHEVLAQNSIQHVVFFKFPSIEGEVPADISSLVANGFNSLAGITAQFFPFGVGISGSVSAAAFREAVAWPDKTDGYTHCLFVAAEDATALKIYLHSDEHLKAWMPAVKPYIKGIIVFDTYLEQDLTVRCISGEQDVSINSPNGSQPTDIGSAPQALTSVNSDGSSVAAGARSNI